MLTIVLAVAIFVGLLWATYLVFVYNTIKEVAGGIIVVGEVIIEPSTVPEKILLHFRLQLLQLLLHLLFLRRLQKLFPRSNIMLKTN